MEIKSSEWLTPEIISARDLFFDDLNELDKVNKDDLKDGITVRDYTVLKLTPLNGRVNIELAFRDDHSLPKLVQDQVKQAFALRFSQLK